MNINLFRNNICEYALTFLNKDLIKFNYDNHFFVYNIFNVLFNISIDNYLDKFSKIDSIDKVNNGSVLSFNNNSLLGIYMGNNKVIYLDNNSGFVIIKDLGDNYKDFLYRDILLEI